MIKTTQIEFKVMINISNFIKILIVVCNYNYCANIVIRKLPLEYQV